MASSWIPPIPGGKLTSKPARAVGSAIVFLHWCYEAVNRDGTIEFQISDVAGYLDESYYTVRKWWSLVRGGPWFTEVTDRGKRGFKVRMSDDWLEWRGIKSSSSGLQMHDRAFEDNARGDEMTVKSPSTQNEMHDRAFDAPAYKVLHDDQDSHVAPLAQKRDRAARPKAEAASPPEVREAIAKGSAIDLRSGLKADILQVNTTARHLWAHMRQPDQAIDSFVADIRWAGKWIRKTQHPYKGSEQRIPPSALIKFWAAAMEARPPAHLNGAHVNGIGPPQPQPQPIRETAAEIAARMQREGFRPPKAQDTNP